MLRGCSRAPQKIMQRVCSHSLSALCFGLNSVRSNNSQQQQSSTASHPSSCRRRRRSHPHPCATAVAFSVASIVNATKRARDSRNHPPSGVCVCVVRTPEFLCVCVYCLSRGSSVVCPFIAKTPLPPHEKHKTVPWLECVTKSSMRFFGAMITGMIERPLCRVRVRGLIISIVRNLGGRLRDVGKASSYLPFFLSTPTHTTNTRTRKRDKGLPISYTSLPPFWIGSLCACV